MTWLITGGAGYIGSHVVRALAAAGHATVVFDDLSTGKKSRVPAGVPLVVGSILDGDLLASTLREHGITGVVHLAAKKSVAESVENPELYELTNVVGTETVLAAAHACGVKYFVNSSSAAVYGESGIARVSESDVAIPASPYGATKLAAEGSVDRYRALGMATCSLRYFNVAGSVAAELRDDSVANLFPIILRNIEENERPKIFGNDYETPDGTCIRDYVHVRDIADAHMIAAEMLVKSELPPVMNIGTGTGSSVLEVVRTLLDLTGSSLEPEFVERRAGDIGELAADVSLARKVLGVNFTSDVREIAASLIN